MNDYKIGTRVRVHLRGHSAEGVIIGIWAAHAPPTPEITKALESDTEYLHKARIASVDRYVLRRDNGSTVVAPKSRYLRITTC